MSVQTSYSDFPAAGFDGMTDGDDHVIRPMKNVEVSAAMPFGIGVIFKSAPTTDQDALLPSGQTDKVAGIVVFSDAYDRTFTLADGTTAGQLSSTGLIPGTMLNVMRKGAIYVTCDSGCAPGDRLYVRCSATGDERLGACENASDSTDMIDCTAQGVWLTTAAAGARAWLEVDFTNKP